MSLGLICCGGAGNSIGRTMIDRFSGFKHKTIFLNTNNGDMVDVDSDMKVLLGGTTGGLAKNRAMFQSLIDMNEENFKKVEELVRYKLIAQNIKIVSIVASTGGGTGSTSSLYLYERLKAAFPDLTFVLTLGLPTGGEDKRTLENAFDTIRECEEKDFSYSLFNNGSILGSGRDILKEIEKIRVNNAVANLLILLDEVGSSSRTGDVVDISEKIRTLSQPGLFSIASYRSTLYNETRDIDLTAVNNLESKLFTKSSVPTESCLIQRGVDIIKEDDFKIILSNHTSPTHSGNEPAVIYGQMPYKSADVILGGHSTPTKLITSLKKLIVKKKAIGGRIKNMSIFDIEKIVVEAKKETKK